METPTTSNKCCATCLWWHGRSAPNIDAADAWPCVWREPAALPDAIRMHPEFSLFRPRVATQASDGVDCVTWEPGEAKKMSKATARSKGGVARAASLTPERRAEIARKAAETRWGKP